MPTVTRQYNDLDLDLTPHPVSGDIIPLEGPEAVKRSIRNILLTNLYERPYRPNIGSRIAHLLFENADPLTKYALRDEVFRAIAINEPRARLLDIRISFDEDANGYEVVVEFSIENIIDVLQISVFMERVR